MSETDKITNISDLARGPACPANAQYANVYTLNQTFNGIYDPSDALCAGTAFAELNMPYAGWRKK